jgi:cell division protein FtsB
MISETVFEYIRGNWPVVLFATVVITYSLYAFIKNYVRILQIKARKRTLEKELADLRAKYSEQAAKLEARVANLKEKLKEKNRFLKRG